MAMLHAWIVDVFSVSGLKTLYWESDPSSWYLYAPIEKRHTNAMLHDNIRF